MSSLTRGSSTNSSANESQLGVAACSRACASDRRGVSSRMRRTPPAYRGLDGRGPSSAAPYTDNHQVAGWPKWWSPVQVSARLRIEFPGDPMMRVSHEPIYQALYVQGRGELRRELARCLRTGRAKRRPRGRVENTGQLRDMVMISQRPAQAGDRAVTGTWEGDLLIGKDTG